MILWNSCSFQAHLPPTTCKLFFKKYYFFQSPLTTYNLRCFFHNLHFFWRCTWFYENIKVPYRNSLQYAEARTSRSLLCVRKRRETIITKHPLFFWGGGVDGRRRIFERPPPPYPIAPKDEISRSGIPLTSMLGIE